MFSKNLRNYLPLLLIILLAIVLRFWMLDKVPNAIGGDEINYVTTAKTIALSGTDLTGTWNPLSIFLFHYPPNQIQSELSYFLLAPIFKFVGLSLLSARFIYALMSTLIVLLIYLIMKNLFSKNHALFGAFIAAINPWFIFTGRTNYEMVPATLFFLLSLYILQIAKSNKIFLSIPFIALSFYSYIATKVILLPFILVSILYAFFYVNKKKYLRQYLIVSSFSLVLVLFFLFSVKTDLAGSRLSEIISPNDPVISKKVDYLRKNSIKNPLTNLFENKPVVFGEIISAKLFNTISFNYLFANGSTDSFFPIANQGLFYYIDSIFLILGMLFMFAKQRKTAVFLIILIIVGLIPHLVHQITLDTFTPHISLIFPFMIIFIGYGIWEALSFFKSKKYLISGLIVVLILYLFSLFNFLNVYFYQFPLEGHFNFTVRVLSQYVSFAKNSSREVIIYSPRSYDIFNKYLFYQDVLNKDSIGDVRDDILKRNYKLGNITFKSCDNTLDFSKTKSVVVYDAECGANPKVKHIVIPNLSDGGDSYRIYGDNLCKNFTLKPYPTGISINDFGIEKLSKQSFCQTFISSF